MFVCGTRPRPRAGFLLAGGGGGRCGSRRSEQPLGSAASGADGGPGEGRSDSAKDGVTRRRARVWGSGECGGAGGSGCRGGYGKRGPGAEFLERMMAMRAADIVADSGAARSKKNACPSGRRISGRRVFGGTDGPQPEPSSVGGGGRSGRGVGFAVRVTAGRSGPGLQFGPQCRPFPRCRCRSGQLRPAQHCRLRPVPQYRCRPG